MAPHVLSASVGSARGTSPPARERRPVDVALRVVFAGCAAFVVVATVAVLGFVLRAGLRGFAAASLTQLLGGSVWRPEENAYGGLPLVVGTIAAAAIAVVFGAVPAALAAVWVHELSPRGVRTACRRVMELASAVPSVVYGWLALVHLVPILERVARSFVAEGAPASGEGLAAAGLLLAIMISPTVHLLSLDALTKVPKELRTASSALGASSLQTAFRVALPGAARGILVAVFFGFARAAGETMAVQMVIGGARKLPSGLFAPTTTISTQIVMDMQNARPGTPSSDVLFSMSLVLLVVSVVVVLGTRALVRPRTPKRRAT